MREEVASVTSAKWNVPMKVQSRYSRGVLIRISPPAHCSINVIIFARKFLPPRRRDGWVSEEVYGKGELIHSNNSARLNRRRLNAV